MPYVTRTFDSLIPDRFIDKETRYHIKIVLIISNILHAIAEGKLMSIIAYKKSVIAEYLRAVDVS